MTVLKGLSFKDEDAQKPCTSFSGGWQMRISLCKLLISRPSFMILDEPSNHLDSAARTWLQNR
jgi:ATP-binding cassette subfamily F protein 3